MEYCASFTFTDTAQTWLLEAVVISQLRLEARVGIGQASVFRSHLSVQSQRPHSQARRVTGNEIALKMGVFRFFVKALSTQALLTNKSETNHLNTRCWHSCWVRHEVVRTVVCYGSSIDKPAVPSAVVYRHRRGW